MQCKHILLVGLFDNKLTILSKLLYIRQSRLHIVASVGTDSYAYNELPPDPSVAKIALDMGFILTSHKLPHSKIEQEARTGSREVFHHLPQPMSRIKDFSTYNAIITPYKKVHDRLAGWQNIPKQKLHWISGIKPSDPTTQAFPILQEWVNQHRF